jgi:hypothetical protein
VDARDRVGVDCSGGATRAVRPAAEVNGGDGAPMVGGDEEEVRKLQGSMGKLGVGPIGVEKGWRGCSTASRGQRRAALVGSGAPAGIQRRLEAGEHEQGSGKLARGLVGAMGARWWLSMVARGSPERESGRRR